MQFMMEAFERELKRPIRNLVSGAASTLRVAQHMQTGSYHVQLSWLPSVLCAQLPVGRGSTCHADMMLCHRRAAPVTVDSGAEAEGARPRWYHVGSNLHFLVQAAPWSVHTPTRSVVVQLDGEAAMLEIDQILKASLVFPGCAARMLLLLVSCASLLSL